MGKPYKIAVISDIHSNYVALKKVLAEIEKLEPDEIVAAGDIAGLFVQPNQTIELLQKIKARIISGNGEARLRKYHEGGAGHWADFHQMKPLVWTYGKLTDDNLRFLLDLPEQIAFFAKDKSVRVVHGTIHSVWELIYKHERQKIIERLAAVEEDILICGHSHQQWHDRVNGTLIVNPGAVGISFMGEGIAPYSIIKCEDGVWSVEEKQAKYDPMEVGQSFEKAGIENYSAWENMLMHSITDGKITTLAFLNYAKEHAVLKGWDGDGLIPNLHWESANETFDWEGYDYISMGSGSN